MAVVLRAQSGVQRERGQSLYTRPLIVGCRPNYGISLDARRLQTILAQLGQVETGH